MGPGCCPEAVGRDAMVLSSIILSATTRLKVATGIAQIHARHPMAMKSAQNTLNEAYDNRFLLGLGVSHAPMVEGVRGHAYKKPLSAMRSYLERMATAPFLAVGPSEPPPTVIAALRPKMIALAAEKTMGTHTYFVPPEHTAKTRAAMGPDKWICVAQAVVLESDPTRARAAARQYMRTYVPTLPNYTENLRTLGFGDADFQAGGSDRLIDALVVWGDEQKIAARIREHHDAGADHVCIQPFRPDGAQGPDAGLLEALAPARR